MLLVQGDTTIAAEPECPVILEAVAIVQAEYRRLRRASAPVRLVTCELPVARRCRQRARIRERGLHWAPRWMWARQRSPPPRA